MKKYYLKLSAIIFLLTSTAMAQSPGDVIVTEFMADPSAVTDATGEWFEILNTTSQTIDMNGWHIKDNGTNNHVISTSLILSPGAILVLANNGNSITNGGLTADYTYSVFTLANTSDEIIITDASGTVIDSVVYTHTTSGKSWSLDPAHLNATDNDNFAYWCLSTTPYGNGDLGTPGILNNSCNLNAVASLADNTIFSVRTIDHQLLVHFNATAIKQKWDIADICGKIILSGTIPENENDFSIPLDKTASGIYFFQMNRMESALKFIVD